MTDRPIAWTAAALVLVGLIFIYSASAALAERRYGDPDHFLRRQAAAAAVGGILCAALAWVDHRRWRLLAYPALGAAAGLLALTRVGGIGVRLGGARRWIQVAGLTVQPSELAKLVLVVYLAYSIGKRKEKLSEFTYGFLPNVVVPGILLLLLLGQPDFGSALVLGALILLMLYVGGTRMGFLGAALAGLLPVAAFLVLGSGYRRRRLITFLRPWEDPLGAGFQIIQSFLSFGSGGWTGRGLGDGRQKLFFLPAAHTDFILSVVGEEAGFLGVLVVLGLLAFLIWRGLKVALGARDAFGALLALGVTLLVAIEALTNACASVGLLPTKGLTLPFVSYGGTSLVVHLAALGLLLSVSRSATAGVGPAWEELGIPSSAPRGAPSRSRRGGRGPARSLPGDLS